jgi:hypothetical protein
VGNSIFYFIWECFFLFILLVIEMIKCLLGKMVFKYFRKRYTDQEIKVFCHVFQTGKFKRSTYPYGDLDRQDLEDFLQRLQADEVIVCDNDMPTLKKSETVKKSETDYKIKSPDKQKILLRIHAEINKKDERNKRAHEKKTRAQKKKVAKFNKAVDDIFPNHKPNLIKRYWVKVSQFTTKQLKEVIKRKQ